MMYSVRLFLTLLLTALLFYSCKKNNSSAPAPVSFTPKQFILTDTSAGSASRKPSYFSLKYASDKQRIDIYYDDTTNSNPYDILATSYVFNSSGYIIGFSEHGDAGTEGVSYTVGRNADNKINFIESHVKDAGLFVFIDTSFFNYQQAANGLKITTIDKNINYVNGVPQPAEIDTVSYSYNSSYKLQEVVIKAGGNRSSGTYFYTYNPNGSIKKIHYDGNASKTVEATFSYTSGLPDNDGDPLPLLYLGKDYYLQDIRSFPPASDRNTEPNFFVISKTNPYHITNMHVEFWNGSQGTIADYIYGYKINADHTLAAVGGTNRYLIEFRY